MSYSNSIRRQLCIWAIGLGALIVAADATAQSRYVVTDLGSLGGTINRAHAVNELGQAAGVMWRPDETVVAFFWDDGRLVFLPPTPDGPDAEANDLNNRSEVVGRSFTRRYSPTPSVATVWRDGVPVGLPYEEDRTQANAINDAGLIVGSGSTWSGPALLWTGNRVFVLPGGRGRASDVNEFGQIVGHRTHSFYYTEAVMWDLGNRTLSRIGTDLGEFDGHSSNLNDFGVAEFGDYTWSPWEAYLWRDGRSELLARLPEMNHGEATAVNNRGVAVGFCESYPTYIATIWENGQPVALNDLIDPASGWNLESALDINEVGQIVGGGVLSGMGKRAFLLTPRDMMTLSPPEPGRSGEANTIVVQGAAPSATVSLFYSPDPGFTVIQACNRLGLNLDRARFVEQAVADAQGRATFRVFIPRRGSGLTVYLQAVETTGPPDCRQTNLVRVMIE